MTSRRTPTSDGGAGGDDELLDQWSFLDSMIDKQAASLRAGAQDPEEDETGAIAAGAGAGTGAVELAGLRTRVTALEAERDAARADAKEARTELRAAQTRIAQVASATEDLAAARAQTETAHAEAGRAVADLALLRREHEQAGMRADTATVRELRAAVDGANRDRELVLRQHQRDLADLRVQADRERHLRERAEAKSAEVMRTLREAHAEVEAAREEAATARTRDAARERTTAARTQVAARDEATRPASAGPRASERAAMSESSGYAAAAPSPPAQWSTARSEPEQRLPHPEFDVFESPKEASMATHYSDGPPATSSADLVTPSEAEEPKPSLMNRLFGRHR
jgi:hypothetical protein